jgi:hypothetical protein
MKPFQKADIPESELDLSLNALREHWKKDKLKTMLGREHSAEALENMCDGLRHDWQTDEVYLNHLYQVNLTRHPEKKLVELSIRRRDRQPIRNWRHLQEIKNMLVGPEHEGFELFPAESRLVDTANQYYMWVSTDPTYRMAVFTDPTYRLPVGYQSRAVSSVGLAKSKNKFIKDERRTLSPVS